MKIKDYDPYIQNVLYSWAVSQNKPADPEMDLNELNYAILPFDATIPGVLESAYNTQKTFVRGAYYKILKSIGFYKKGSIVKALGTISIKNNNNVQSYNIPVLVDERSHYYNNNLNFNNKGVYWDYPTPEELNEFFGYKERSVEDFLYDVSYYERLITNKLFFLDIININFNNTTVDVYISIEDYDKDLKLELTHDDFKSLINV